MRSVMVAVLLAVVPAVVPAHADTPPPKAEPPPKAAPQPKGQPRTLPPSVMREAVPAPPQTPDQATGGRSMDGGFSAGVIIKPPPHPDARPWPSGSVMTPPDVKDPMAIGVQASESEPLRATELWSKRLAKAIEERARRIVELVLPRSL